jgi:hypothetical protein
MRIRTGKLRKKRKINSGRYYSRAKYPNIPVNDNDLYIITTVGDRLDSLASLFYDDIRLWWIISIANPDKVRRDSFNLKPNLELRIPANRSQILKDFEKINRK